MVARYRSIKAEDVVRYTRTAFNMTNQSPTPERIERIEDTRLMFRQAMGAVYVNCPESRERSLALTKMEEALMWAVGSIAREAWYDKDEEE